MGKVERGKLDYGDYTYTATLPSGDLIPHEFPLCSVERKMDLDELALCFGKERQRFEKEFKRAADHGARVYLLVENGNWEKLIGHKYKSRMNPKAFMASITAFMIRYNCNVIFCDEMTSGTIIKEILYRDLKERLERGEYG